MGNRKRKTNKVAIRTKKRTCPIQAAGIEEIDYKDIEFLKLFITEKGKILPRRISGVNARSQKKLAAAIKRARNIALLSFAEGYVSQYNEEQNTRRPSRPQPKEVVEKKVEPAEVVAN